MKSNNCPDCQMQDVPQDLLQLDFCKYCKRNLGNFWNSFNWETNFYKRDVCDGCSNNPKNGGSGVCLCTLGFPKIVS